MNAKEYFNKALGEDYVKKLEIKKAMTPKEAIKMLTEYNNWRRGKTDILEWTPKEIGLAIEVAIKAMKQIKTK